MAERVIDISAPVHPRMPRWPGSPSMELRPLKSLPRDGVLEHQLSINCHAGTHVDAPAHFVDGGKTIDAIDLTLCCGPCQVLRVAPRQIIDVATLKGAAISPSTRRLLLATQDTRTALGEAFDPDFAALSVDAARWIVDRDIALVGTDAPSIEGFAGFDGSVHRCLLQADVVVVEGLRLQNVAEGFYELLVLPLPLKNAEAAPARAVLREIGG